MAHPRHESSDISHEVWFEIGDRAAFVQYELTLPKRHWKRQMALERMMSESDFWEFVQAQASSGVLVTLDGVTQTASSAEFVVHEHEDGEKHLRVDYKLGLPAGEHLITAGIANYPDESSFFKRSVEPHPAWSIQANDLGPEDWSRDERRRQSELRITRVSPWGKGLRLFAFYGLGAIAASGIAFLGWKRRR